MDRFACALIDALGGTAKVAQAMHAPASTVSNMRSNLTSSRLNHLRRIAQQDHPDLDVEALAAEYGVELPPISEPDRQSSGSSNEVSRRPGTGTAAPSSDSSPPPFPNQLHGTVQTAPETSRSTAERYVGAVPEGTTSDTNSSAISSTLCDACSTSDAVAEVAA